MILRRQSLHRAVAQVRREMRALSLWQDHLAQVQIRHGWFAVALGYQWYGDRSDDRVAGDVVIPRFSLTRVWERISGQKRTSLVDLVRHELAHAFADLHGGWFRSKVFSKAFGRPHDAVAPVNYHPEEHLSAYAATSPCEDFAETFMTFVRHRGVLPKRFDTEAIRRKWDFVNDLRVSG